MKIVKAAAVMIVAGSLAACANNTGMGNKELGGTVVGAALGGLVGSQFGSGGGKLAATALGVALGGFIGNQIGQSLDKADQAYANQTAQQALNAPTGTTSSWHNPQSGNGGSVTPQSDFYRDDSGRPCRDMEHTITYANGSRENVTVTECQNADGSWEITS